MREPLKLRTCERKTPLVPKWRGHLRVVAGTGPDSILLSLGCPCSRADDTYQVGRGTSEAQTLTSVANDWRPLSSLFRGK